MNFLNIYPNIEVQIQRGEGVYLFSNSNKRYLDLIGGIGVNILGYHDPDCDRILSDTEVSPHFSNLFLHSLKEEIAAILNKLCKTDKVFFTNSGTESIESSLKFAWKVNPGKIIAFEGSFHGRSLGAFSLSHLFLHQNYPRINAPIEFVCFNEADDLWKRGKDASIIIFEPIQGAGGVRVVNKEIYLVLKELQKKGALVITDEIQSGLGRTGNFLASDFENFQADIITLAKGLGCGLPLGAVCMKENIASNIHIGDHGTTMGGNLKALQLSRIVIKKLTGYLMKHIREIGENVVNEYKSKLKLRGRGLFLGFDVKNGEDFARIMREEGYLVNIIQKNTVRLLPPYIIKKEELRGFFNVAKEVI